MWPQSAKVNHISALGGWSFAQRLILQKLMALATSFNASTTGFNLSTSRPFCSVELNFDRRMLDGLEVGDDMFLAIKDLATSLKEANLLLLSQTPQR